MFGGFTSQKRAIKVSPQGPLTTSIFMFTNTNKQNASPASQILYYLVESVDFVSYGCDLGLRKGGAMKFTPKVDVDRPTSLPENQYQASVFSVLTVITIA